MLVEALKQIQGREKLTDKQIAEKLCIHEKSWNRIKNGRSTGVSMDFIRNAVHSYPELGKPVLDWVYGEEAKVAVK